MNERLMNDFESEISMLKKNPLALLSGIKSVKHTYLLVNMHGETFPSIMPSLKGSRAILISES